MNMNKNNFSLVVRIKRTGSTLFQLFPINHRTKYPIFFGKLLERINSSFKRLRKHRLNYKGYLFSNYKL